MAEVTSCFSSVALLMILYILHQSCVAESTLIYNVLSFGAKPNGVIDSTQAFLDAWIAACASSDSTTIYAITAKVVTGVFIIGGALDAKGTALWACKLAGSTDCPNGGATSLSFTNSKNININGLMSLNSQMFHFVINGCQDVRIQGVKVNAAGNSPNTDGIHVQLSTNVAIFNTSIKTGDDCVSIGPGTKDVWIEQIICGPGHGISLGSLAKDLEEEGVQNVTVKNAIFKAIEHVSGMKINDVVYRNIQRTSASAIAIKFDCSATNPCSGIRLENVSLTFRNQEVQSHCANANGKIVGTAQANSCL
ncbi:hypothetical protein PRUPE_2G056500 [Prunus persica]|uniref:Polygalacturonase n=1 Tax=Prunus persica TaxID=3760 RepID=A0A251QBS5_PRUPE|nr:hypothetical protein PRUPE_2G056500 [Prunus persica]